MTEPTPETMAMLRELDAWLTAEGDSPAAAQVTAELREVLDRAKVNRDRGMHDYDADPSGGDPDLFD